MVGIPQGGTGADIEEASVDGEAVDVPERIIPFEPAIDGFDVAALFNGRLSGADVDPTKADCIIKSSAGEVQVMKDGFGTDFSEELAKAVLTEHDITVIVDFHSGDGKAVAYGCDLTYEYVKINGDYRT